MRIIRCFNKTCPLITLFVMMNFATKSWGQQCVDLPEINGHPGSFVAPNGWVIWNSTPDIINGNGNYPGVTQATVTNVNGNSNAGGEMAFFLINAALGSNTEGLRTTINSLTPGITYLVAVQWQQVTLDYNAVTNDPSGGKLEMYLDGTLFSTFTSSDDVNDNWQTAYVTFTATASSHIIGIKGAIIGGQGSGAIVVDNLPCGIPLSTDFYQFEAFPEKDEVLLSWSTNSEHNNDYFSIERSADIVNWSNIGTLDGAGNSSSLLHYSFIDNFPLRQTSYYRLKQVDINGAVAYSEIKSVQNEGESSETINIFPNPATTFLSISGKNLDAVSMIDVAGRSIAIGPMIRVSSGSGITLSTAQLLPGTYFIIVESTVKKVVIQ